MSKELFDQALSDFARVRDQARLELHLLSMEAKERLGEFEKTILEMEDRLKREGEPLSRMAKEELCRVEGVAKEQLRGLLDDLIANSRKDAPKAPTSKGGQVS